MWNPERRPPVLPPARWRFPRPIHAELASGLRILAFPREGQHIASVGLVLDTPLSVEPPHVEGVATLVHRCLDEGTLGHPGTAFAEALEDTGAVLGGSVGHSATELLLDVPVGHVAPALSLLSEAVTQPTLAAEDVLRHRELRLAQIEQVLANSAQRAGLAFREACIPDRFRASRPAGGRSSTVSSVTPEDVRAFHSRHYRPDGATVILTGDFTADPLEAVAEAFDTWPGGAAVARQHEQPEALGPRCLLVDRPGSVQADVRLGGYGIDRADPRWADLQVACHALGGAFLSRLNRVLREERGYTYGVHLVSHPMRHGGLLALQGSFRNDVVVDALGHAQRLMDVSESPLSEAEVVDAVNYTTGVAPLRYATASGVTEQVAALVAVGLGASFVDSYLEALLRVTAESATRTIAEVLPPDRLTLVVVGDAQSLAGPLREAGWSVDLAIT